MPMITTGFLPIDLSAVPPSKQPAARLFSVAVTKADGTTEDRVPETEYPLEATAAAPFHLEDGESAARSEKLKKKSGLVGPAFSDVYALADTTEPDAPTGFGETTVSDDPPPPPVEAAPAAAPVEAAPEVAAAPEAAPETAPTA